MFRRTLAAAAVLSLALAARPMSAQSTVTSCSQVGVGLVSASCAAFNTARVTIPTILRLTLPVSGLTSVVATEADFDAGFIEFAGPQAAVKANRPWLLDVMAVTANWSYTPDAASLTDPGKLASDLLWRPGAVGAFTNDMGTSALLASGNGTPNATADLTYRLALSYATDVPGVYDLEVMFTLIAP